MTDPSSEYNFCPRCATPLETRPVGDKQRRACPHCKFIYFPDPKVGVGVVVIQSDKILLVERKMNPGRGKWSIPAGFVDRGEDPRDTAVREAWEETNLNVEIAELLDVYFNPGQAPFSSSIFIMYRARLLGGELRAGDDASAAAFFGLAELPPLAFASTRDAVGLLLGTVNGKQ